ncbi:MAG: cation transporter [Clostridia bacterium]|nr:cation transporter [Clostridia bacterium]
MNGTILQDKFKMSKKGLRLAASAACTLALIAALFLHLHAALQLFLFLIVLALHLERLHSGLDALSAFAPNAHTLVLLSALAALLHGIASATEAPYYAYAAVTITLVKLGDAILERLFGTARDPHTSRRFCRIVTSAALLAFVLTLTVRLARGEGILRALDSAAAALIVSCPAVIGIILPLANFFGAKVCAKNNILLCRADTLEKLGSVNTLVVGSSSVVYAAEPSLYDLYAVDADKAALLAVAAAIEQRASHPFAEAIILAAAKLELPMPHVTEFAEFRGKGVCAAVGGEKYFLGNRKLFREQGIPLPDAVRTADLGGYLPLYAAKNGAFCGMLLLGNTEKADVPFAVEALRSFGIKTFLRVKGGVILLDGEREKVLQEPKNNATIKKMLYGSTAEGEDALCIAGIAGHADVLLPRGGLYDAYCALLFGRKARGVLLVNLLAALCGSMLCLAFATGLFDPLGVTLTPVLALAAVAVTVAAMLLNSMRLRSFTPPPLIRSEDDDMFGKVHYTMQINGMSCAHCSARVKTALESLRGTSAQISLEEKCARVKCPASLDAETLTKAVTEAGYTVLSCERV